MMTNEEALEIIAEFNREHQDDVNGVLETLWPLFKAYSRGLTEIGEEKFQSWAELRYAQEVIDGHTEKVKREKEFIKAVFVLAEEAAEFIIERIMEA